jgi:site-specific DNA-methyltransferase (adenine-specific)
VVAAHQPSAESSRSSGGDAMTPLLPAFTGSPQVNTVYNVDALTLLRALPDNSIDMVLTSPPYDNLRTYNGYTFDFQPIARETFRVLKTGGVCVWVVGDTTVNNSETLTSMRQALYFVDVCGFNMHDTMIYQKDGLSFPHAKRYNSSFEYMFILSKGVPCTANLLRERMNKHAGKKISNSGREPDGSMRKVINRTNFINPEMGVLTNVWLINTGYMKTTADKEAYQHPAMFPEELARRHIETWTNAGDTVLDYFGGSGTTAKEARKINRKFLICDTSAEYCDLMRRRLALPFTPMFAELAG